MAGLNGLADILDDILGEIFEHLTSYQRSKLCVVCKRWETILVNKANHYMSDDKESLMLTGRYHTYVRYYKVHSHHDIFWLRIISRISNVEMALKNYQWARSTILTPDIFRYKYRYEENIDKYDGDPEVFFDVYHWERPVKTNWFYYLRYDNLRRPVYDRASQVRPLVVDGWYYTGLRRIYRTVDSTGGPCQSDAIQSAPLAYYESGSYEEFWYYLLYRMCAWNNYNGYPSVIQDYALEDVNINWQGLLDVCNESTSTIITDHLRLMVRTKNMK